MLSRLRTRPSASGERRRLDLTTQQWVMAFLIGTATVVAAIFGWRAAAIGSTAAFDDRQSISETIRVEQQRIDIGIAVVGDTREHTRYLGDYAAAAELENQAAALAAAGNAAAAEGNRAEARTLRATATERAADAGVFGRFSVQDDLREPTATPRPFSLEQRAATRAAEAATSLGSPGRLDPDGWARGAEDIRDRIQGLAVWSFVLLFSVLLFTVAQANTLRRPVFYAFLGTGVVVLLAGVVAGFTIHFPA
jgi:hypothetical protein